MGTDLSTEFALLPRQDKNTVIFIKCITSEFGDVWELVEMERPWIERAEPDLEKPKPKSKKALVVDCTGPLDPWQRGSRGDWSGLPHRERDQFQQKPLVPKKEWMRKGERKGKPHNPVNQPRQSQTSYKKRNGLRQK